MLACVRGLDYTDLHFLAPHSDLTIAFRAWSWEAGHTASLPVARGSRSYRARAGPLLVPDLTSC